MRAVLDHTTHHNSKLATYWFKPEGPFRFVSGEFTELFVPHDAPDDRGQSREFTISSTPEDSLIGITTTFPEPDEPISSFKQALKQLQPGNAVQLAETKGDFVAPRDHSIPLVFVAGGVGITPALSMVKSFAETGQKRDVQIVHSVTDKAHLLGDELFTEYSRHYVPAVTKPDSSWTGLSGRLSAEHTMQIIRNSPETLWYLAGPKAMTDSLKTQLLSAGMPPHQIITDAFTGY